MTGRLGLICDDWGNRDEVSINDMKKPHVCSSCGGNISLSVDQIERIEHSIAATVAEVEERLRAGEDHVHLDVKLRPEN